MVYDADGQISEIYHYLKWAEQPEFLSSREYRTYDLSNQLIESTWAYIGGDVLFYNRRAFQWENGNLVKEEYYDGQELLFDQVYEYDDKPAAAPFTHFGLQAPIDIPTANNVKNQTYIPRGLQPDGLCTPCLQLVNYDGSGRPATTETSYGYFATYHY